MSMCQNFVQNAWRRDLCSNCFKSSSDHSQTNTKNNEMLKFINGGVNSPLSGSKSNKKPIVCQYQSQATTIYHQSRNYLASKTTKTRQCAVDNGLKSGSPDMKLPSTVLTDSSVGQQKKYQEKSVKFLEDQEALVIGYGGDDYDPNDRQWELGSDDGDEWIHDLMDDTTEERIITRMTKENTEFNSDNNNLLNDKLADDEVHVMNVKNAISKYEGKDANRKCNDPEVLTFKTFKAPPVKTKVGEVKEQKKPEAEAIKEPPSKKITPTVPEAECKEPPTAETPPEDVNPLYSTVSKPQKPAAAEKKADPRCTCPKSPPEKEVVEEPHYKVPLESSRTVVPDSMMIELLNYDVPNRLTPPSDPEEPPDSYYDEVKPLVEKPPELPAIPPPDESEKPKPLSSFLHNQSVTVPTSSQGEGIEPSTTTNPIYTPTDDQEVVKLDFANCDQSQSDCEVPSICNVYDAVDCPKEEQYQVYQDVEEQNSPNEYEISKHRPGCNKRPAPLPPKKFRKSTSSECSRNSLILSSGVPNRMPDKAKCNSLGNFNKVRLSLDCRNLQEDAEQKPKKNKFWRKFLNKFHKDEESSASLNDQPYEEVQFKEGYRGSLEIISSKKGRLQIVHPIDFEHSGGPQIIESSAISTSEEGLPSVVDCTNGILTTKYTSSDAGTSSDSGGNYESVGDEEDLSSGINEYSSPDEHSSDYFESSNSDCSAGEMVANGRSEKPMPPVRTKSAGAKGHQAPSRPPPPKYKDAQNTKSYSHSPTITDCGIQNEGNSVEPEGCSDEEEKRRKAPEPPKNQHQIAEETIEEPNYQNLNNVDVMENYQKDPYYESLNLRRNMQESEGEKGSSKSQRNSIEVSGSSNDSKSTDSGFIDYEKSSKDTKDGQNTYENGTHLYEKIESGGSSPRSLSPNESGQHHHHINQRRNVSGLFESSFKRSGKRLSSLSFEGNYSNIVCMNHETLAFILENVQRVKSVHPISKRVNSLKWQEFEVISNEPIITYKNSRVMLAVRCKSDPETSFTLIVAKDGLGLSPSGNAPFILNPLAQFTDVVPTKLFEKDAETAVGDQTSVQAHIWVLDSIQPVSVNDLVIGKDNFHEVEACFVMLQLITALKFLQAHGVEELDSNFDNFIVNANDFHLFIFEDSTVQPRQSSQEWHSKFSLCHAAIAAMLNLLRDSRPSGVDNISSEILASFEGNSKLSEFLPIANILMKEKAVSLSQAKSLLEYMLWGPPASSFDRQEFCTPEDLETVIQRWLDQERANFLSNVIRISNDNQPLFLTPYEEYKLIFLVRTSAKVLREASIMLEPEVTLF